MSFIYKNSIFTLFILFVQLCYSHGACPSLMSTKSVNVTCKHNNKTLANCENAMEGTEAHLTCNMFYEEATIEANPKRLCRSGKWDGPIPQCYPICGVKRIKKSNEREEAEDKVLNYPWHVVIYDNNQTYLCLGTLIAMNKVLTAAKRVTSYNYINNEVVSRKTIFVGSGKLYPGFNDIRDNKYAQYGIVKEVHFPDNYEGRRSGFPFDIAILVLANPFQPSAFVQPACLDFNSSSYNYLFSDRGILTGWDTRTNATGTIYFSNGLKVQPVVYIPNSLCSSVSIYYEEYFKTDKICGLNLEQVTFGCIYYLGGGMVLKNKINDRYYIIGILSRPSFKISDIYVCDPNQYSLYTAVSHYQSFVENYTVNIEMKNCILPNHPQHGKYSVVYKKSGPLEYKIGYPVPPYSKLTLICDNGYTATQYHCLKNGKWNPALSAGCAQNTTDQLTLSSAKSTSLTPTYFILIVLITVIVVVTLIAVLLYEFKFKQDWQIRREIKLAGLDRFHNGNLKRFNPELDIGDQAEILPYNNNFEFPRDKLRLGKQLGSGAFGIVLQADAFGIIANEKRTTVAVKMVRNVADYIHMKALISELKIMVHLGQHLNVVNLLGACTQNIIKRELLVIVEYCRFGNLYDYLLRNRENYIDQIDNVTGNIDYSFGIEDLAVPDNSRSNNSCNNNLSELSSNYCQDYKESSNLIHTKDLVSWSFQVARGMEYLASRKILHGDLAARNILLADDNIVKICDFGLAKRLCQSRNYKKRQDSALPIKWMAIESIRDRVFSTQSDVWSFGIVLWELFSLAQTPYPGIEADERLYYKLLDGYKMDSPPYAPKEMYKIMCDCWSFTPASRPSFNQLAGRVGLMLDQNVRQHYIELNDPYFVINTQRLSENQVDYLEILRPPGFQQITIPHNDRNSSVIGNDHPVGSSEYLCLTPTDPAVNKAVNNYVNVKKVSTLPNQHNSQHNNTRPYQTHF